MSFLYKNRISKSTSYRDASTLCSNKRRKQAILDFLLKPAQDLCRPIVKPSQSCTGDSRIDNESRHFNHLQQAACQNRENDASHCQQCEKQRHSVNNRCVDLRKIYSHFVPPSFLLSRGLHHFFSGFVKKVEIPLLTRVSGHLLPSPNSIIFTFH